MVDGQQLTINFHYSELQKRSSLVHYNALYIKTCLGWKAQSNFSKRRFVCEASLSLLMDWDEARRSSLFNIFCLTNIYLLRPSDSKSKPQGFWSRSFGLFSVTNEKPTLLNISS